MIVSIIVAAAANNAIGKNNQLLWHLPRDMKFFKNTTWALPVVMGRKTFESMGGRALPGRKNIVITRQAGWSADAVLTASGLKEAIAMARDMDVKEIFVIGGGEIYKEAITLADKIYMTRVHAEIAGDVFFPVIPDNEWTLLADSHNPADEKHAYSYSFQLWERKK